jgi:hypothetical protein
VVVHVRLLNSRNINFVIQVARRWISSLPLGELIWNLVISSVDQVGNLVDIGSSIAVVVECGEEALDVPLVHSSLDQVLLAEVQDEVPQLVNGDVAVRVCHHHLLHLLGEGGLVAELLLQPPVDLDHAVLDLLDHVLRHLLLVQHDVVVVEDGAGLANVLGVGHTAAHGGAGGRLRVPIAILGLDVVEGHQVLNH